MQRTTTFLATSALVLGSLFAASASAATLGVVHGINGTDLGPSIPEEFPVDITVVSPDGASKCVKAVKFKNVKVGALEKLDQVGEYEVKITLRDGSNTCGSGTLVIADTVNVSAYDFAIVVAHLDASNTPVVRKYNLNGQPLPSTDGRVSAIHAAAAPPVLIVIKGDTKDKYRNVQNGEQTFPASAPEGTYAVQVILDGDLQAKKDVKVFAGKIGVGIAVGSAANETLEVIRLKIGLGE
jgi:hypothetical protein